MDKKILTAEEILEKATEQGYEMSLEDCEATLDAMNSINLDEASEIEDMDEADLENVAGGGSIAAAVIAATAWVKTKYARKPRKRYTTGKFDSFDQSVISEATRRFGMAGHNVAVIMALAL